MDLKELSILFPDEGTTTREQCAGWKKVVTGTGPWWHSDLGFPVSQSVRQELLLCGNQSRLLCSSILTKAEWLAEMVHLMPLSKPCKGFFNHSMWSLRQVGKHSLNPKIPFILRLKNNTTFSDAYCAKATWSWEVAT